MVTLVNSSLWKKIILFYAQESINFYVFIYKENFKNHRLSVMLLNCARLTYAVKSHCNYFGPFYLFSCDPERSHKSFSLLMISFVHIVQLCIENSLVEKKSHIQLQYIVRCKMAIFTQYLCRRYLCNYFDHTK